MRTKPKRIFQKKNIDIKINRQAVVVSTYLAANELCLEDGFFGNGYRCCDERGALVYTLPDDTHTGSLASAHTTLKYDYDLFKTITFTHIFYNNILNHLFHYLHFPPCSPVKENFTHHASLS